MQAAAAVADALKKQQERARLLEVCQAELRALKGQRVRPGHSRLCGIACIDNLGY